MYIKDIMSTNVEIVSPETLLHDVAKKMQSSDCGSVMVGDGDRLVGVITDRDLALRCVAESHHPEETTAAQVMTKQILYCHDTDTLEEAALDMTKNKVRRLPVLNKDKRLVGIVSLGDMAVHSTDEHHRICGKALGDICAIPLLSKEAGNAKVLHA
ncbi:MAG: CBS domain-containing protein [Alphaproteobacteria bacterium]|nr:CBS domain-containing protein [Alphaproteobacteria bacterium]